MRDTYFKEKIRPSFDGVGQVLGGETKPSRLVPSRLRTGPTSDIPPGARVTSKPPGNGTISHYTKHQLNVKILRRTSMA